ncbi:MAG: AAA family ATPase, partial [Bacteroidota bacterium]
EETAALIDGEVRNLVNSQYERAQELLGEKRAELEALAKALLENEVLLKSDVERLIGPRPTDVAARAAQNGTTHEATEEDTPSEEEAEA